MDVLWSRQYPLSRKVFLWGGGLAFALISGASGASAQEVNITPSVTIQQQQVRAGDVTLRSIIESGAHFYSYPYFLTDGWGEGADGPRADQRRALYPNSPFTVASENPPIPFLRLNGIDSQSCYECHDSIGGSVPQDLQAQNPEGPRTRTQPAIGGSAGIANNAFINDDFPAPLTELIRNPPHVFGAGYTQSLAAEMTAALIAQKTALGFQAKAAPGMAVSLALSAKGLPFGTLSATYDNSSGEIRYDTSAVTGVLEDLVVRPFQWKGIASTVRHFVASATTFHFSMEAVEEVGVNCDNDKDGVYNELSFGNVGAVSTFVALTRPPIMVEPTSSAGIQQVQRGQGIFNGTASGASIPAGSQMCASCHIPEQTLDRPVVTMEWGVVLDSEPAKIGTDAGTSLPTRSPPGSCSPTQAALTSPSLINPVAKTSHLPVVREILYRLEQRAKAATQGEVLTAQSLKATATDPDLINVGGLEVNLTTLQSRVSPNDPWVNMDGKSAMESESSFPAYAQGRLPSAGPDGAVSVPLFSDLRLHDMGPCLTDIVSQTTDVATISVPPKLFLTRPLWGVADTWPYLHDGRGIDLVQAIRFHGGTRPNALAKEFPYVCAGSEADPVINAFYGLSSDDQNALIAYLQTLRLPELPGSTVPF